MSPPSLSTVLAQLAEHAADEAFELTLDAEQLAAVVRGLRAVEALGDEASSDAAQRAFAQIAGMFEASAPAAPASSAAPIPISISAAFDRRLDVLRKAIVERRKVTFGYSGQERSRNERVVRPLGLTFLGTDWELVAWCELREAFRTFRLGRMDALAPTDETFPLEPGRRIQDFMRKR